MNIPASIPGVTGVGGTEFSPGFSSVPTGYLTETTWNDTPSTNQLDATGGGVSIFYPKPSWQAGLVVTSDSSFRSVPDIAFSASNEVDPYEIVSNGSETLVGGTSAAAPTMAGIVTLLNQYLFDYGTLPAPGLGNINPMLYSFAQSTSNIFHDITTGTNKVPCEPGSPNCPSGGTIGYSAGTGYDRTTGLGSIDAFNLATWWGYVTGTPSIATNPVSVSFGGELQGVATRPQPVIITNSGNGLLNLSFGVAGTNATDFSQTNSCGTQLIPGNSCTAYVVFTPQVSGTRSGLLAITDNAAGSPQNISLNGTGIVPTPSAFLNTTSISFNDTVIGLQANAQSVSDGVSPSYGVHFINATSGYYGTITLANTGTAPLTSISLSFAGANAGDFSQISNCGTSLAIGASCNVTISFSPSAIGSRTSELVVFDNAPGAPQMVSLAGNGIPGLLISQTQIGFGNQYLKASSAAQLVAIKNPTNNPISFSAAIASNPNTNPNEFITSTDCGTSIGPGITCGITLWFHPFSLGPASGNLEIEFSYPTASSSISNTITVPVSGVGVSAAAGPILEMSPGFITTVAGNGTFGVPASGAISTSGLSQSNHY